MSIPRDTAIEYMPQDTLSDDETAVAQLPEDQWSATLIRHDDGGGTVRLEMAPDHPDEPTYHTHEFDRYDAARLAFGLWAECGPYQIPESGNALPVTVAVSGQAAIAAYLLVGRGRQRSRAYVAQKMGVTEQTVSNYAREIRWNAE